MNVLFFFLCAAAIVSKLILQKTDNVDEVINFGMLFRGLSLPTHTTVTELADGGAVVRQELGSQRRVEALGLGLFSDVTSLNINMYRRIRKFKDCISTGT